MCLVWMSAYGLNTRQMCTSFSLLNTRQKNPEICYSSPSCTLMFVSSLKHLLHFFARLINPHQDSNQVRLNLVSQLAHLHRLQERELQERRKPEPNKLKLLKSGKQKQLVAPFRNPLEEISSIKLGFHGSYVRPRC